MQIKSLNIFLLDGNPFGKIKCTIPYWTGTAYKIPRDKIEQNLESGLYFLFGGSSAHIGKPENLSATDWQDAVIFVDNSLGLTEINFLENKFYNLARAANRYKIINAKTFASSNITPEKESELEIFAEYVKIIVGVLGYKIFEPTEEFEIPRAEISADDDDLFYLSRRLKSEGVTVEAKCRKIGRNFVVLAGSKISQTVARYVPDKIKKARKKAKISAENILLEDMIFDNPSSASAFVVGISSNGWVEWRTSAGITLKDFEGKI